MDISGAFDGLIHDLISLLPLSPFAPFLTSIAGLPGLAWLNWFLPISEMLAVFSAWLGAVALFLIYSVLMRWVKLISG